MFEVGRNENKLTRSNMSLGRTYECPFSPPEATFAVRKIPCNGEGVHLGNASPISSP